MNLLEGLKSGVAGALTVTLLNEVGRQVIPAAPRMDVIGERAIARPMRSIGQDPPEGARLYAAAMTGDLLSNTLYYSLIGLWGGRYAWRLGIGLGLLAGLGGAYLPPRLGLGRQPGEQPPATQLMTIAWYFLGALVAAAVASRSDDEEL